MKSINKETGEILNITNGGLYTPLAVPAYQVLVKAGEHIAKDVLVCLISHMGMNDRSVYPSYTTICRETGRGRESVAYGLRVLEEFGFIRKFKFRVNEKARNKYWIQDSCYYHSKMNALALSYTDTIGRCWDCNAQVKSGNVGVGKEAYIHYGCGGKVMIWKSAVDKVPPIGAPLAGEESLVEE